VVPALELPPLVAPEEPPAFPPLWDAAPAPPVAPPGASVPLQAPSSERLQPSKSEAVRGERTDNDMQIPFTKPE
jgi:hypothetical protein